MDNQKPADDHIRALVEALEDLPVEEMIGQGRDGEPILLGYCMQAQGEWDRARKALAAAKDYLGED